MVTSFSGVAGAAKTPLLAGLLLGQWPALAAERVLIIGATSRNAGELIPQALARGYEVTALARRALPAWTPDRHVRRRVRRGLADGRDARR